VWRLPEKVRKIVQEAGVDHLCAETAFGEYMDKHGIKYYLGSVLSVGKIDPHPSAIGHQIISDVMYRYIEKEIISK
jgi:hypothetical protein